MNHFRSSPLPTLSGSPDGTSKAPPRSSIAHLSTDKPVLPLIFSSSEKILWCGRPVLSSLQCADTCGDGQNISYPFYIRGNGKPYCGYPGFELSCNNNSQPTINISTTAYIVQEIFYRNQTLRVSNSAFSNTSIDCIPLTGNVSFPGVLFDLAPNQTRLFLLYNCNSSLLEHPSEFYHGCYEEKENRSVLALPEGDLKLRNASQACRSAVVAPIESYGVNGDGIRGVLRRGFLLKWKGTSCSFCQESGGLCGFNHTTYNSRCLCADRPHVWHCRPESRSQVFLVRSQWGKTSRKLPHLSGVFGRGMKGFPYAQTITFPLGINKKVVIIAIALSTGIGVLMVMIWCFRKKLSFNKISYFWKQESLTNQNLEAFFRNYGPLPIRRYSYSNIKKMTNFFKDKLGQGGYGGVYKGKLSDGSLVAVKVLKESRGTGEEFINEVASISRTSHVNIVTLMGFCFEDSKRALIYEFMPNGSLDKFIYKKNLVNNEHKLEWKVLYNIAVGIARGLEYLHRGCNTRILHFDIKPHNILLDENFCPKISDFGLAKICSREESIISLLGARGTAGYIAPEIVCRNFGGVSHKSDVYSYGMMVLEMVGGRKNLDDEADRTSEIFFPHLIYNRLELDEELGLLGIMDEKDEENARKMIIVSLWCIQTNPSSRPSMSKLLICWKGPLTPCKFRPSLSCLPLLQGRQ
ncbi:hypothetical protein CJ030_MR7G000899 [Morella rubra]|uniref:non-specific serine/threonine protein kinase n=1 Tax=Morella rubra TaxID=262757 RepID=A0A6A1UYV6_9ROSI|nr:hypothetical protein CJ030_MR7G000899 [Morella rubra]